MLDRSMDVYAGSDSAVRFEANADEAARVASVEQLEAAVAARPSLATLAAILEAVSQALHDPSPAVLKRAIPAAHVAFRYPSMPESLTDVGCRLCCLTLQELQTDL